VGCVAQINVNTEGLRGGRDWCDFTWTTPSPNPMGHNYVDTFASQYQPRIDNGSANTHTFTGWASDNQTDS
jgi:hypothetical protein